MKVLLRNAVCAALYFLLLAAAESDANQFLREQHAKSRALVVAAPEEDSLSTNCAGHGASDCMQRIGTNGNKHEAAPVANVAPEFEPTHEWKEILPNQALPPGLYIRVNLATGKKEAKLLD
uniref:Uncharacterized protein n=1 Tax=Globisporangium ultimum (strain ATCC 200006 / CBS 805.95 / DAOM BR144) TaxID=431595 RepID=K3WKB1_GLOUD